MQSHYFVLFVLVATSFIILTADGLKCYICNSFENKTCGDPFDHNAAASFIRNCNVLTNDTKIIYSYCRKTIQRTKLRGRKEEDIRIIRTCGYRPDPRFDLSPNDKPDTMKCYKKSGTYDVDLFYCGCHEGECNPASRPFTTFSNILAMISGAFSLILCQYFVISRV